MKTIAKKFDSLTAFSSWLAVTPNKFDDSDIRWGSRGSDDDFYKTPDYETANNMMLGGWSDGAKRIQAFMTSGSVGAAPARRVVNSVVGFAPNVPAAIAGRPLNMRRAIKVNQPRRVVSIFYNTSVAASVDASDIEKNAAKLFNVVAGLERSGVRVELWVGSLSENVGRRREYLGLAIKIKSADQPLNVLKMCYPVVHPSFNRRHKFSFVEKVCDPKNGWDQYGRKTNDIQAAKMISDMGIKDVTFFDFEKLDNKTEEEILKMIK